MNLKMTVATLAGLALAACPGDPDTSVSDVEVDTSLPTPDVSIDVPAGGITYHGHVRAIVQQRCVSCHTPGGVGPFPLETWEQVEPLASVMVNAVDSGRMPPWDFDPGCRDVQYSRALSPEQEETMRAWQTGGFLEGDPADFVDPGAPPAPNLGEPDLVIAPAGAYTASKDVPDDYRCLTIDHTFTEDTYVTATDVYPGERAVVHHVLIYAVPPNAQGDLDAKSAAEPDQEGYTCFGGPDVQTNGLIAGWVPGMPVNAFPEGAALSIGAGSKLVMQIHYNVLSVTEVPADTTSLALWTLPAGQQPTHDILLTPLSANPLNIPAGDPNVVQEELHGIPASATIIGAAPHMHQLGVSTEATLIRNDGTGVCLSKIPEWDFNWQQFYQYEVSDHVEVGPTDQVRIRCTFDNSPDNQPVVNGQQQQPRDVTWGEGTFDEMCITYFMVMRAR